MNFELSPRWRRLEAAFLIAIGLVAAGIRLPLLSRAEALLTSDEAIVGLMAREITAGNLPVFFWGQRYMGSIESYVAAMLFGLAGDSAALLKSAPLLFFLLFLVAHYALTRALTSPKVAVLSSLLLAAGPPVLVSWSVRAMAGYMETLLFGTVFLAAIHRYRRTGSKRSLFLAGIAAGLGWWTSQLVACYLSAGILWFLLEQRSTESGLQIGSILRRCAHPRDFSRLRQLGSWLLLRQLAGRLPNVLRYLLLPGNILAAVYAILGLLVLLTGGFDTTVAEVRVKATDGWKLVSYALSWSAIVAVVSAAIMVPARLGGIARRAAPALAGFLLGYLPALIHALTVKVSSPPTHKFSLPMLLAEQIPAFFTRILPLLAGGGLPDIEEEISLPVTLALLALLGLSLFPLLHDRVPRLPAMLCLTTMGLFLFSGIFVDYKSYRYLLPLYPAIAILAASGLSRMRAGYACLIMVSTIGIWGAQDASNLTALRLEVPTSEIIGWMREKGIRAGYADYWIAYRLDYLSRCDPLLAPYRSQDRNPAYTAQVRNARRVGYVFRAGDPEWPAFMRARADRIEASTIAGRYRLYVISQPRVVERRGQSVED
ncbi:MAG: glycosyltransferase family 39 protein [Acidobacteria bacterium]|nr:glycosyltransferase family 39 protein [Acidobacteriota bacterium]